jgi:ribosomal protein S18 acetylase RimI-like enzyme
LPESTRIPSSTLAMVRLLPRRPGHPSPSLSTPTSHRSRQSHPASSPKLQAKPTASSKAKDKKAARKAAAVRALAAQALVKTLKATPDLLEPFPAFRTFSRNGLSLNIEYLSAETAPAEFKAWAFDLTKRNVQGFYEGCPGWGWNDAKKRRELEDPDARFLVATVAADAPTPAETTAEATKTAGNDKSTVVQMNPGERVGFVHLRFEMEGDEAVLYVYEIHVDTGAQGRGLGRFMMQVAELFARKAGLARVMLTVFTANEAARRLYAGLGYVQDKGSPGVVEPEGDHGYDILTKRLPLPPKPAE